MIHGLLRFFPRSRRRFAIIGAAFLIVPGAFAQITTAPTITTQPQSLTITTGSNATFAVAASGTAPLSYQWRKNGRDIGFFGPTATVMKVLLSDAGNYDVVVTNAAGSVASTVAMLTVTDAPVAPSITTQPQSLTVTAGSNATFAVAASGTAPLSYQWRKNGSDIGFFGPTATVMKVLRSDAGSYDVIVTNAAGSVASNVATLTVADAPVAPTITTQPQSLTVTAGSNATFAVAASGTAPLSYQWRKNGSNIGIFGPIVTVMNVLPSDAASYDVVVTNAAGSVASNVATLTVTDAPVAPTITTQPQSVTALPGSNATFSVAASGTAPLSYQWRKNGSNIGIFGPTVTVTNVLPSDAGSYYDVVVTNAAGSVASAVATLTVTVAPVAPTITTQPQSVTALPGSTVTFSVAASGTGPLSYQWRKNGSDIGVFGPTVTVTDLFLSDAGSYDVVVTNVAGSVASNVATLTITGTSVAPTITTQPQNQSVAVGASVTFTVVASGTSPFSYQWLVNGTLIDGATSASFSLDAAQITDVGNYTVEISNGAGSVTSNAAQLAVTIPTTTDTAPVITVQPQSQTVVAGASVTFTAVATGTEPLYQWFENGVEIDGAITAAFSLTNVQDGNAGTYSVVVSNDAGSVISLPVTLTVLDDSTAPQATTPPASQTLANAAGSSTSSPAALAVSLPGHLINLSILTSIASRENFILGAALGGAGTSGAKPLLVRAAGPTLGVAPFNLPGVLPAPTMTLNHTGVSPTGVVATNSGWGGTAALSNAFAQVGAFPFVSVTSKDAALFQSGATALAAGSYTVQVTDNTGRAGTVLTEIYDATPAGAFTTTTPRLINVSVLKQIDAGANLTVGFVVGGSTGETVLIRAVGPTLGLPPFNLSGVMADPKLDLFSGPAVINSNNDWGMPVGVGAATAAQLSAAFTSVGAFALANAATQDAAVLVTLAPGSYSVQVSGVGGTGGLTLVEVYEVR